MIDYMATHTHTKSYTDINAINLVTVRTERKTAIQSKLLKVQL